jgi:hypothetical protein
MGRDLKVPRAAAEPATWRIVAASVQGASHRRDGTPCQDANAYRVLENGTLLAAVADGAGSARLAEDGSRLAVQAAIEATSSRCGQAKVDDPERATEILGEAVQAAIGALREEAAKRGVEAAELATTLIVALATPGLVAAAQLGDGAAVVRDQDGALHVLSAGSPAHEFINETVFLTSANAHDQVRTTVWLGRPRGVALLTDGLEPLALHRRGYTPHAPFFEPIFRLVLETETVAARTQLESFFSGPRVSARADDDLTLLLAVLT